MAPFEKVNIPQKPPMVMVDRLVSIEGKTTITAFRISPDNIFVEKGLFREPGLIENMAQTAAAGVGAHSQSDNAPPPEGFIHGEREFVNGVFYHKGTAVASLDLERFLDFQV